MNIYAREMADKEGNPCGKFKIVESVNGKERLATCCMFSNKTHLSKLEAMECYKKHRKESD